MLSLLASFKNESHILAEWIASHAAEGVDHFYLVNNNSTDDFEAAIANSGHADKVTLLHDTRSYSQHQIYNDVFREHIQGSGNEWLLICDLDEFVYARNGFTTIADYLATVPEDASIIGMPWKIFGSSGFDRHPETGVIANFVYRDDYRPTPERMIMNGMCQPNWMTSKYIVRINQAVELANHTVITTGGKLLLASGREGAPKSPYQPLNEDLLESYNLHINHYVIQSREYFEKVKMTRGDIATPDKDKIRDWDYFKLYDTNVILDNELATKRSAASA